MPSLVGGLVGAWLLIKTPPSRFAAIVPRLVLGATVLFIIQKPLAERLPRRADSPTIPIPSTITRPIERSRRPTRCSRISSWSCVWRILRRGDRDSHARRPRVHGVPQHSPHGLKNWGGLCANAVAAATFAFSGLASWPVAGTMAVGATLGGYSGSRLAQRVPQARVRQAIIAIGLASAAWLLTRV